MKNIRPSNNLRSVYLRSVQVNDSDCNFYSSEMEFEIISSLLKAGAASSSGKQVRLVRRPLTPEELKWIDIINNRPFIEIEEDTED